MQARLVLPVIALLATPPALAAARGDEASARAAVMARFDAAIRNDVAALEPLLADDLEYCTFRGNCLSKEQYLADIGSGRVHYVSGNPTVSKVKLFADGAVVTGVATVSVIREGVDDTIHISWAAVLAWRNTRWQMTTWTSTLLEPAK